MCKSVWIGVDLAKSSFHAAIAPDDARAEDWARLNQQAFDHTQSGVDALCAWIASRGVGAEDIAGVCVEATGRLSWTFVELLNDRLGPVSIVNPARPVQFAKSVGLRDKTDRTDACVLALFGLALRPTPRPLPTGPQRQLRELARFYARNRRELTATENQLREPIASAFVRRRLQARRRQLLKELEAIEREMDTLLDADAKLATDAELIQTIPGVARKTTRTVLAYLGDLSQYTRAEITACNGIYPRQYASGTSVYKRPRLAKAGGARVRAALYMAALSVRRYCPHMRAFAERLRSRGLSNKAVLCAVMRKLLLLMRALVVNQTPYQPRRTG